MKFGTYLSDQSPRIPNVFLLSIKYSISKRLIISKPVTYIIIIDIVMKTHLGNVYCYVLISTSVFAYTIFPVIIF